MRSLSFVPADQVRTSVSEARAVQVFDQEPLELQEVVDIDARDQHQGRVLGQLRERERREQQERSRRAQLAAGSVYRARVRAYNSAKIKANKQAEIKNAAKRKEMQEELKKKAKE